MAAAGPLFGEQPHRRFNALTDEWLLVSARRGDRPWLGQAENVACDDLPAYDPSCYLCPGNVRATGERNPDYLATYAFTNDFPALRPELDGGLPVNGLPDGGLPDGTYRDGLLRAETERGTCRVVCFSPRHDLTLGRLPLAGVRDVVELWTAETTALGASYRWVQVFENRGAAMGSSNPHPHGQVWAGTALPREGAKEDASQRRHAEATGRLLLADYARQELGGPRIVAADEEWIVLVPFWAAWPFETLVVPRRPATRLPNLDPRQRERLAERLVDLLGRLDGLFGIPFPYSMGWHQAPFDEPSEHWQVHAHFYPPLLQAGLRKFMVGYELLAEPQRDITAEEAAERLRAVDGPAAAGRERGQELAPDAAGDRAAAG